ncbi:hypothetical protein J4210_02725 [Candidatus Woesearchaeota archaeon]|nr:hypothetical protein [uncultured archaeon]MBS3169375.1 hypothetical protein [Candidatus Woesearchaeota archaeon]
MTKEKTDPLFSTKRRRGRPVDFSEIVANIQAENQRKIDQSKPQEELIVPLEVLVESAEFRSADVTVSDQFIGVGHREYRTGQVQGATYQVSGHDVVRELSFAGGWPEIVGENVRAYVFKGKTVELSVNPFNASPYEMQHAGSVYHERDFEEKEQALRIEVLDENGKVSRTYKAAGR